MTADSRARRRDFAKRLDLEPRLAPFLDLRWDGQPARPLTLHLDDVSAIPFLVNVAGVEEYQHRARARAEDGDMYVAVTPQTPGYEDYCATHLRLSPPRFLLAEPVRGPMAVARAAASGKAFAELVDATRAAGGMLIHPYMGTEEVWDLARRLATETGGRVAVLAPPPPITWIANDKALFSEVVEMALGRDWLVDTRKTAEPAAMARLLMEMSGRHEMVALKRTRCASAMGNQVFQAADLRVKGVAGAERDVSRFLERTEWPGDEEVLIVAWEDTPLSPSTQIWIPPSWRTAASPRRDLRADPRRRSRNVSSGAALPRCRRRSTTSWPARRYEWRPCFRSSATVGAARSTISCSAIRTASFGRCSPSATGGGVARARR